MRSASWNPALFQPVGLVAAKAGLQIAREGRAFGMTIAGSCELSEIEFRKLQENT